MPIQLDAEMRDIFVVLTVEFLAKKAANVREYYFFHRLFREYFNFYFLVLTVKNKTISRKIKMQLKNVLHFCNVPYSSTKSIPYLGV